MAKKSSKSPRSATLKELMGSARKPSPKAPTTKRGKK